MNITPNIRFGRITAHDFEPGRFIYDKNQDRMYRIEGPITFEYQHPGAIGKVQLSTCQRTSKGFSSEIEHRGMLVRLADRIFLTSIHMKGNARDLWSDDYDIFVRAEDFKRKKKNNRSS